MWSRLNIIGSRRRWAVREDDPGRLAGPVEGAQHTGRSRRRALVESAKRAFLARDVAIDCTHPGCKGVFVTSLRELGQNGSAGSKVVLRCTRQQDHTLTIRIRPYTPGEHEKLRVLHRRGERLQCARCGAALRPGWRSGREWFPASAEHETYFCPWCGVTWEAPSLSQARA